MSGERAAHEGETLVAPFGAESIAASTSMGSGPRVRLAGRYDVVGLVGSGGMGTVYRAIDLELDEVVALKMLRREVIDTPGILDRFRREVKLARRVTHRNVARVFDIGEHEGEKFLTMEFVDGESLASMLSRDGALPVARAVEIATGVAAGLASAHAAGVIHRDLKPDNVLLTRDGRAVLTDFGIARAFDAGGAANTIGLLVGTPAYMAPEQVEGRDDVDARADIYAFGAVLYELVTGARAWGGESPFAVASARLVSPPPDPRSRRADLPTSYAELTLRCMARRPADRPASLEVVADELSRLTLPAVVIEAPKTLAVWDAVGSIPSGAPPVPEARASDKTVAVLPFRNSGSPDDDYLAEELTDDLIDALSMTRGLKVRSRGVVQRFRGTEADPREIGRELGVQVVATGTVRRAVGRVRITARLVGVADGFQLWAKRFDRPEAEVLSINDEAARAIAEALTLDRDATSRAAPSDPLAIDLYLRARHEYRKFWPDHLKRAIELFDQAATIAPGDPMILAGRATALARYAFFTGDPGVAPAREAAQIAVAASPELGEARLALGSMLLQAGDVEQAARELRLAVTKSPGLAEAHAALGRLLGEVGSPAEAVRRLEAALAIDPQVPLASTALARMYALMGRWDDAIAMLDRLRVSEGEVSYWAILARTDLWRSDAEGAARHLDAMPKTADQTPTAMLFHIIARREIPELAEGYIALGRLPDGGIRRRLFFLQLEIECSAYLGQIDRSLTALELAADVGLIDLVWLARCPALDPLRRDPRFGAAHARVKRRCDAILAAYNAP